MDSFEDFIDTLIDELDAVTEDGDSVATAHIEEEQAFIILSKNPKEIIERLTEFTKLGPNKVGTGELLHIVDTFYDTIDGDIRDSKKSLRVRELNGVPHVTIKGKNLSKDGGSKRSEFEVEWPWQEMNQPDPHDVAKLFGMEVIQRRETERIARPITRWDDKQIAELAIDKVTYDFGEDGPPARVYEVEIEMKSSKGPTLKTLSDGLRKKFDDVLWPWEGSKYAMGRVLEHALTIKLDDDGYLTYSSFYGLSKLKV